MENVPCEPSETCKWYPNCYSDTHHLFYPKRRYKGGVERQFRELPENKAELCRQVHDELHATQEPPVKPSREVMYHAIAESAVYLSMKREQV